jgi:hypothetical protein
MSPSGWFINNTHLLLSVLESGKAKAKMLADLVSDEGLQKACFLADSYLLALFSHGGKDKDALWGLFHEGMNPINEGSILMR